jgi:hypothetical protein
LVEGNHGLPSEVLVPQKKAEVLLQGTSKKDFGNQLSVSAKSADTIQAKQGQN